MNSSNSLFLRDLADTACFATYEEVNVALETCLSEDETDEAFILISSCGKVRVDLKILFTWYQENSALLRNKCRKIAASNLGFVDKNGYCMTEQNPRKQHHIKFSITQIDLVDSLSTASDFITRKYLHVYLLDGSYEIVYFNQYMTVKNLCIAVKEVIGLKYDIDFGLFLYKDGEYVKFLHDEKQLLVEAIGSVMDNAHTRGNNVSGSESTINVVYRRKQYFPLSPFVNEYASTSASVHAVNRLEYAEVLFRYLSGYYRCTLTQCIQLGAYVFKCDAKGLLQTKDRNEELLMALSAHLRFYVPADILYLYESHHQFLARQIFNRSKLIEPRNEKASSPHRISIHLEQHFINLCKLWFPEIYGDVFFNLSFESHELNPDENHDDMEELHVDMNNLKDATLGFGPEAAHISYSVEKKRICKFERVKYASITHWATNEEDSCFFIFTETSVFIFYGPSATYVEPYLENLVSMLVTRAERETVLSERSSTTAEVVELCQSFNVDKNYSLNLEDFESLLKTLGKYYSEKQLADARLELNGNPDGTISITEFQTWWEYNKNTDSQGVKSSWIPELKSYLSVSRSCHSETEENIVTAPSRRHSKIFDAPYVLMTELPATSKENRRESRRESFKATRNPLSPNSSANTENDVSNTSNMKDDVNDVNDINDVNDVNDINKVQSTPDSSTLKSNNDVEAIDRNISQDIKRNVPDTKVMSDSQNIDSIDQNMDQNHDVGTDRNISSTERLASRDIPGTLENDTSIIENSIPPPIRDKGKVAIISPRIQFEKRRQVIKQKLHIMSPMDSTNPKVAEPNDKNPTESDEEEILLQQIQKLNVGDNTKNPVNQTIASFFGFNFCCAAKREEYDDENESF